MSDQKTDKRKLNLFAMQQTSSVDDHNPSALKKLAETIDDHEAPQQCEVEKIKLNLVATLNDDELSGNNVDFHYDENASELHQADPLIDDFTKENIIPARYKLQRLLGSGTSGHVFSVHDNNLYRNVAAKFMHPADLHSEDKTLSFIQEARITANLNHPNILPVHDLNYTDGGLIYFTMNQVEGQSLDSILESYEVNKILPAAINSINDRIYIISQVCNAIAHAHSLSIIHNDIKPSNIMIGNYGEVLTVDWGTACSEDIAKKSNKFGTPIYMSPEQAKDHTSDHRSDIYCIGTTLFHLLTLRIPCWHEDIDKFWEMKCEGVYSPPTKNERKHIPKELLSIAEKAMAVDPDQRYQHVTDIILDIDAYQNGQSVSAYNDGVIDTIKRIYRRNRKAAFVGLCGICAIFLLTLTIYLEKTQSQKSWLHLESQDFNAISIDALDNSWVGLKLPNYSAEAKQEINISDSKLWFIKNDALHFNVSKESAVYNLVYKHRINGNMRIRFDYTPHHAKGNINCFISGRDRTHGYTFHVGGWGKLNNIRLTKDNTTLVNALMPFSITENETYHIQMERVNNRIGITINDHQLIDYNDPDSLNGLQHQQFGIDFPTNHSSIDNINISYQPLPRKVSPLSIAHANFDNGLFAEALQIYKNIRNTYTDPDMKSIALYRIGRCLTEIGKIKESGYTYKQFIKEYPKHELVDTATVNYIALLGRQYKWDDCSNALSKMGKNIKASAMREALSSQLNFHLHNYARCLPEGDHPIKTSEDAYFLEVTPEEYLRRLKQAQSNSVSYASLLDVPYDSHSNLLFEYISNSATSIGAWEFQLNELSISKDNIYRGLQYLGRFDEALTSLHDHPRSVAYALSNLGKIDEFAVYIKKHANEVRLETSPAHPALVHYALQHFPNDRALQVSNLYYHREFEKIISDHKDFITSSNLYALSLYHLGRYDDIFSLFDTYGDVKALKDLKISLLIHMDRIQEARDYCIEGSYAYGFLLTALAYKSFYETGRADSFDELDSHPMYGVLYRHSDHYLLRPLNALYDNDIQAAKNNLIRILSDSKSNMSDKHRNKLLYITGQLNSNEFMDTLHIRDRQTYIKLDGEYNLYTAIKMELAGLGKAATPFYKNARKSLYSSEQVQYIESRLKALGD